MPHKMFGLSLKAVDYDESKRQRQTLDWIPHGTLVHNKY